MIVKNIKWDVDTEDILEKIDTMSTDELADIVGVSVDYFENMDEEEQKDYVLDYVYHTPNTYADFLEDVFELPKEVELPESFVEHLEQDYAKGYSVNYAEEISDWLTDRFDFCHDGFELDGDLKDWGVPSQVRIKELKAETWNRGVDAISDLLGYEYDVEEDHDTTDSRMDMAIDQMSDETFDDFYMKYCSKSEDLGDFDWDL